MPRTFLLSSMSLSLSLVVLLGCGKSAPPPKAPEPHARSARAPQVDQAAQNAPQAATQSSAPPATPPATPRADAAAQRVSSAESNPKLVEVAGIEMQKPVVWTWQAPTVQFRALQYSVPSSDPAGGAAELIFSVFAAGDGGPIDANVKRWVSQFRTQDGDEVEAKIQDKVVGEIPVKLIELAGHYQGMGQAAPRPGMMQLGAIIQLPQSTVFVRIIGPEVTVEAARGDFDAMIASVRKVGE